MYDVSCILPLYPLETVVLVVVVETLLLLLVLEKWRVTRSELVLPRTRFFQDKHARFISLSVPSLCIRSAVVSPPQPRRA